jgi:hypothetical protein
LDAIKTRGLIGCRTGVRDLNKAAQARDVGGQQRIPDRQIAAPLDSIGTQCNGGEI